MPYGLEEDEGGGGILFRVPAAGGYDAGSVALAAARETAIVTEELRPSYVTLADRGIPTRASGTALVDQQIISSGGGYWREGVTEPPADGTAEYFGDTEGMYAHDYGQVYGEVPYEVAIEDAYVGVLGDYRPYAGVVGVD